MYGRVIDPQPMDKGNGNIPVMGKEGGRWWVFVPFLHTLEWLK